MTEPEDQHPAVTALLAAGDDPKVQTAAVLRWAADRTRDGSFGDPVGGCGCGALLDRDAYDVDPPKWDADPDAPTVTTTLQAAIDAGRSLAEVHEHLGGTVVVDEAAWERRRRGIEPS